MTIPDHSTGGETAEHSAFEEWVIEVCAGGETAVIGTEARIVEEIVIRKIVMDRVQIVRDTVRRTEVDIEDSTTQR